jgi:hypothetical protein
MVSENCHSKSQKSLKQFSLGARLESVFILTGNEGSNPSLSVAAQGLARFQISTGASFFCPECPKSVPCRLQEHFRTGSSNIRHLGPNRF